MFAHRLLVDEDAVHGLAKYLKARRFHWRHANVVNEM